MASAERVRALRESIVSAGSVVSRMTARSHDLFPVAIGDEEGLVLRDCVRRERAANTLEVGLGYGIASLFICEGLLDNGCRSRHVAIDPYQLSGLPEHRTRFEGVGLQVLRDAGIRELVEFYEQESQIVLPRLLGEGRRFDLAFIDGDHHFETVLLDLVYAGRLIRAGGVVFVDDAQLAAVRKALAFCVTNLGWVVEDGGADGAGHTWRVLRTAGEDAPRRPYSAFVDF
jgi:predicted O-methyltransferase YrrM